MALNKEFWDKTFPDKWDMFVAAKRALCKYSFPRSISYSTVFHTSFAFFAEMNQAESRLFSDSARVPAWARERAFRDLYPISIGGLTYKPTTNYLTAEGYPLGTTCWYCRVDCGPRYIAAHEDPEQAVLRTVLLALALFERRKKAPEERDKLQDILRGMRP